MAPWTDHRDGPCPIDLDEEPAATVLLRYRNGMEIGPVKARSRRWQRWSRTVGPSDWDIVAWQRVG